MGCRSVRRIRLLSLVALTMALASSQPRVEASDRAEVEKLVVKLGRTRWTNDNSLELLADPRRAWEARLDLLESARSHLFLTTFSWHEDEYGTRFRQRLADVVRERSSSNPDFQVHCVADAVAVGTFNRSFDELRKIGADVRSFNRASWGMSSMFGVRMHDKIVVADGRQAIVGGRNYADIYYDPLHWWLDFGVLVEGPAVWDLQMIFLKTWSVTVDLGQAHHFSWPMEAIHRRIRTLWSTGRFPDGTSPLDGYLNDRFFPEYESPPGESQVAVLYDNPILWRRAPTMDLLVALVRGAESEIDLMTPFPNFPDDLTEALTGAAERGVRVRIIVNHRTAAIRGGLIQLSTYPSLMRLVEAGVDVWAWKANPELLDEVSKSECFPMIIPPVALHGKIVRIDNDLTIVHSSNFNIRSTYYNSEAGIAVLDGEFNGQVRDLLDGLLTLRDFDVRCTNGDRQVMVDRLVEHLDDADVGTMRDELGAWRRVADGFSMLW
jgi:phosphatidylserine/phosphatidylglycerophosphate/cardiolipin synthase-like enzyme